MGNALQASSFYCIKFGFKRVCYRGLETGHREFCSHVVQQNKIFLVFQSPYDSNHPINQHLTKHGDGVRDIAFNVDDATGIYNAAIKNGAKSVKEPWIEEDKDGKVIMASISTVREIKEIFISFAM